MLSSCHENDRRTAPFHSYTQLLYLFIEVFLKKDDLCLRVVHIYLLRLSFIMTRLRMSPTPPQKIKWNKYINGLKNEVVSGFVFIWVNQLFRNKFIGFVRKIRIFLSSFPDRLMKHTVSEKITNQKVSFFSMFSMTGG